MEKTSRIYRSIEKKDCPGKIKKEGLFRAFMALKRNLDSFKRALYKTFLLDGGKGKKLEINLSLENNSIC